MDAGQAGLIDATDRPLGDSGLGCGPLGFGCWRFVHRTVAEGRAVLEAALDHGLNLVDTADVYGLDWGGAGFGAAEDLLGAVLREAPELRDRMVLATKGGIRPGVPYDSSPAGLRDALDASLRRLGVEVIDLYQVHRPDLFAHPADVADVLAAMIDEGSVRAVGVSNHTVPQYQALFARLADRDVQLATTQPELSVAALGPLRDGTLDLAMRDGVIPIAWSALAGGRVVTGDGLRPELLAVLDELAEREGVDRAAVAIAFLLAHPSRPVVLIGSQRPERLAASTRSLGIGLDRTDCYRIVEAADGVPLP